MLAICIFQTQNLGTVVEVCVSKVSIWLSRHPEDRELILRKGLTWIEGDRDALASRYGICL
jgi:hypothetical protein